MYGGPIGPYFFEDPVTAASYLASKGKFYSQITEQYCWKVLGWKFWMVVEEYDRQGHAT